MKTTVDLPEELLTQAKVYAAQHNTTLKELIMQGLEQVTTHPARSPGQLRQENARRLIAALQGGNTKPIQPLTREEIHDRSKGGQR